MKEISEVYRKYRSEFPDEITFKAQAGHLVGLKLPDEIDETYKKWSFDNLPINVPYIYKVNKDKHTLIQEIKQEIASGKYDYIIHAGDPDGEGELLVRLVLTYLKNALPVKRFWTNDLTEGAIRASLKNLIDDSEKDNIYSAALLRQHLDYRFGMNMTVALTVKSGATMRIGRVKAPIIRLIVDREKEIENFVDSSKFRQKFDYQGCEFVREEDFETEMAARNALPKTNSAVTTNVEHKNIKKKAPKLYKLSTIQTDAHSKYKFSGAETLSIIQSLYEKKFVSYPRTDCEYISSHEDVDSIIKNTEGLIGLPPGTLRNPAAILKDKTYANDKVIATEGHTALIPTGIVPHGLSDKEEKIYEMILRRFLAIFAPRRKSIPFQLMRKRRESSLTIQIVKILLRGMKRYWTRIIS